jgi:uncharacterized membrane protein (DUF4010 family)
MFVRNLVLLALFSPRAGLIALAPISVMALCTLAFVSWQERSEVTLPRLALGSPLSIRKTATFGALFLLIEAAGSLGQRFFGQSGTVVVSLLGGFVSSASSTAAASLSAHKQIGYSAAALATVLASIASAAANLPIVYRQTKDRRLMKALLIISALVTGLGLLALALVNWAGWASNS